MKTSRNGLTALAVVAAVVLVVVLLTMGRSNEDPLPPGVENIPTEIERPDYKPQRPVRFTATAPKTIGTGFSQQAIDEVWQLTQDFLREETLRPELMISHIADSEELFGAAKHMTPELAKRWRSVSRRALAPYEDGFRNLQMRPKLMEQVYELYHWNLQLSPDRGWQNPMFTKGTVDGLVLMGPPRIGAMVHFTAEMRLQGKGHEYRVPFETTLFLIWVQVDGEWRVSEFSRGAVTGAEREVKDGKTVSPSPGTTEGSTPLAPQPGLEDDPTAIWPS